LKIDYTKSFLRDLKRVDDQALKDRVRETIEEVERVESLSQVAHLKKIELRALLSKIALE
jgi:hypothetical protein